MFKIFKRINYVNSNATVQCDARGDCRMRHTELCKTCKHNCGEQKDKTYYKPIKK